MKTTLRQIVCIAVLLTLAGCGGGGGSSSSNSGGGGAPGALEPGGAGLTFDQTAGAAGASVAVSFSSAVAINDVNEVVGFVELTPGAGFIAGYWRVDATGTPSTTPSALPAIPGNTFCAAASIDDAGNAVGQSARGAQRVAVYWPFGGVPVELPALTGAGNSAAYFITQDGTLVAGEAQDAASRTRAVVWVGDGAGNFGLPVVLPVNVFSGGLGISPFSSASAVARVGAEIWVAGEALDGAGVLHAALWRSNDGGILFTAVDLAAAGEVGSAAYGVGAGGQIVGESETAAGFVPVRWVSNGAGGYTRTSLAAAGGAVAVNDNGRAAGWSGSTDLATVWNNTTPATLFSTQSQAYSLNNSLQPLVVGRSGSFGFVKRVN